MIKERNKKIAIAVLRGWTLAQAGLVFKLSHDRIKQITVREVSRADKTLWEKVSEVYTTGSIRKFRKHKNRLISIISGDAPPAEPTLNSVNVVKQEYGKTEIKFEFNNNRCYAISMKKGTQVKEVMGLLRELYNRIEIDL